MLCTVCGKRLAAPSSDICADCATWLADESRKQRDIEEQMAWFDCETEEESKLLAREALYERACALASELGALLPGLSEEARREILGMLA